MYVKKVIDMKLLMTEGRRFQIEKTQNQDNSK